MLSILDVYDYHLILNEQACNDGGPHTLMHIFLETGQISCSKDVERV
jgi:hypothetical protein